MRLSNAFAALSRAPSRSGGCQTEKKPIPVMSVSQYEALPPGQKPTMFRDSNPRLAYPDTIHETDGLSRNPDDCAKAGAASTTPTAEAPPASSTISQKDKVTSFRTLRLGERDQIENGAATP